ncbi:hypothetical protein OKW76_07040 [Sphingomonas sp. S1-29]|uniref:hypothetical protein n=1 Tax=Sphingomonas sp. S1-29 TaxID=2991074 RepID=UPI002240C77A|nr:hypothetical protein [Sphingomonas sp. S1-29]UZK70770.1 hypothetical protein OKW76_07040 [Sphingomonas sp. S1-29]
MLFHFWERQVGRWAQYEGAQVPRNFKDQCAYISNHLQVDDKLELLHLVITIIKHDDHNADADKRRAQRIWDFYGRHDLFQDSDGNMPTHKLSQPYDNLKIVRRNVEEFAVAVSASGPRVDDTSFDPKPKTDEQQ